MPVLLDWNQTVLEEFQHLCRQGFLAIFFTFLFSMEYFLFSVIVSSYGYPKIFALNFRFLTLPLQKLILELTWQLVPDQSLIQVIPLEYSNRINPVIGKFLH